MKTDLSGLTLAVLGGDDRETIFVPDLMQLGASINIVGFELFEGLEGTNRCQSVEEALVGVDAAIMPMPGTDAAGTIRAVYSQGKIVFTSDAAELLAGKPLFIGVAKPFLRQMCSEHDISLIEIAELDVVAILNSIPSAEGALQIAMEETPFTIHGSNCFVLGLGRTGMTLARMLKSMGARTFAAARKSADLARAFEQGHFPVPFAELEREIGEADIIFNTVPAMVLDEKMLTCVRREALIVDLSSTPGGTDFKKAEEMGIKAILTPGLPGKVAPQTAGKILSKVLPELICQQVKKQ